MLSVLLLALRNAANIKAKLPLHQEARPASTPDIVTFDLHTIRFCFKNTNSIRATFNSIGFGSRVGTICRALGIVAIEAEFRCMSSGQEGCIWSTSSDEL